MGAVSEHRYQGGEAHQDRIQIVDPVLRHGFAHLPRLVLRAKGLSDKAKVVYALLLDYAWQQGSCFPGQHRLAQDLSTTERTIRRALEELKRFKLIDWKRRGLSQTNVYYILSLANHPLLLPTEADRTVLSAQDRTRVSTQNRTTMSDKIDPEEEHSDINLRNSKCNALEKGRGEQPSADHLLSDRYQSVQHAVTPLRTTSPARHSAGFTVIGQTLAQTRPTLIPQVQPSIPPADPVSQDTLPEQLAACIQDIAQESSDTRHLRSNLTQALRLLRQSGLPESVFVTRLYEARAITRDRRTVLVATMDPRAVSKPMAYFWQVVRDQLSRQAREHAPDTVLDPPQRATRQGSAAERTNGQPSG